MKTDRKTELRVGLISIVAIVILTATLFMGNQISFFADKYHFTIEFPTAAGLKVGEPVMLRGVILGKVDAITITNSCVQVIAEVDDISLLHSDAGANIAMLELTGGRKIELFAGTSGEPFNCDQVIQGCPPADMTTVLSQLMNMQEEFGAFFNKVDVMVTSINAILGDTTLGTDLKRTLSKTETTIDGLNSLINNNAGDISVIVDDLRFATRNIKTLLSENNADISAMIQNMNRVILNVEKLTKESQNVPANLNEIMADLKKFTATLDKKDTAFGLMFNDPAFGTQLRGTLDALDSLANKIDKHGINANIRLGGRP